MTADHLPWWELARFVAVPKYRTDPYPLYRRLREDGPVQHSSLGVTLVSGYDEVTEVLRHRAASNVEAHFDHALTGGRHGRGLFSELPARLIVRLVLRLQHGAPSGAFQAMSNRFLILMDPPDHTRIRSLASRAFTPRIADEARAMIETITAEVLDELDATAPVDMMEAFAYRIPILVICRLLGVPVEEQAQVCAWVPDVVRGLDVDGLLSTSMIAHADAAAVNLTRYFAALAERRRADPGDDLFSRLVAASDDGDRLASDELVAFAVLLFAAGHETTANLVGNGLWHLLDHQDQLELWRDEPRLRRHAIDELLRYDSPIQITQRMALEPLTIGGVTIPTGRQMTLLLGAANRDPAMHSQPDLLDVTRPDCRPLSFGFGIHHCIGAALARVEAEVMLGALIDRHPRVRPVETEPRWRKSIIFRGLSEFPVRLA